MAVPVEDINFDLHDNRGFVFAEDEDKSDETNSKLNNETTESTFQPNDHSKRIAAVVSNTQDELRTIITICIFFGVSVTIALILTIYLGPPQVIPHGGVSSRNMACSEIGGKILKEGGSAVDSSIAAILCESVYDRTVILGCGVLTYHDQRKNSSHSLDFSCSNARNQMSKNYAVEYPTLLKALAVVHEHFGLLKWKDVLQSVITHFQAEDHSSPTYSVDILELLIELSLKGVDFFYNDYLPKANWTGINEMQLKDLKSYKLDIVEPQKIMFKDYFVEDVQSWSGSSIFMLMTIVENLTSSGKTELNSTDFYHYFVEAVKLVDINLQNITKLKTSDKEWKSLASYLASMISDDHILPGNKSTIHGSLEALTISIIGPNDDLISVAIWHGNKSTVEDQHDEAATTLIVHNIFKPCALRFAITGSNYVELSQILINHFGKSMNLSEAIVDPKILVMGDRIYYEEEFSNDILEMLKNKGHLKPIPFNNLTKSTNNVGAIWKDKEVIESHAKGMQNIHIF